MSSEHISPEVPSASDVLMQALAVLLWQDCLLCILPSRAVTVLQEEAFAITIVTSVDFNSSIANSTGTGRKSVLRVDERGSGAVGPVFGMWCGRS